MEMKKIALIFITCVALTGCKNKIEEPVNKDVALSVMSLKEQVLELKVQTTWLKTHLNSCLSELEKQNGLKPMEFDLEKAMGLPKLKSVPDITKKHQPFYTPYKPPQKQIIKSEDWTNEKLLHTSIAINVFSLTQYMMVMEKYIENFEGRLKRLEERLNK